MKAAKLKKVICSVTGWFWINMLFFALLMGFHFSSLMQPRPAGWPDAFAVANIVAGGLVSFFFYWLVVTCLSSASGTSSRIASGKCTGTSSRTSSISLASQKGGRRDLHADTETIDRLMTVEGYSRLHLKGVAKLMRAAMPSRTK